jgi:hypothetical protein
MDDPDVREFYRLVQAESIRQKCRGLPPVGSAAARLLAV